jgi:flagellar hook-length control protein FliK
MNTIPPVAPTPQPSDPLQSGAAASSDSAPSSANSQNFATTLHEAGGKPGHKTSAAKAAPSHANGRDSPAVGNQLPPPQTPLPVSTAPPAAIQTDAVVQSDAKAASNGPPAIAALRTQDDTPAQEPEPAPVPGRVADDASAGSSPPPAVALPDTGISSAATALTSAGPTAAASPAPVPVLPSTVISKNPAAAVGVNAAESRPAAMVNGIRDSEKIDQTGAASGGTAGTARQATSAPTPADDVNSQAALAAAATGVNPAAQSDSSNKDKAITADSDAPATGAAPVAPAIAATAQTVAANDAKTAVAAVAVTAAAIAQLRLSDTRETAGEDKNSRAAATDSSTSGTAATSNDGSAGAAQLLSAVNSTAAPTPLPNLKVAAGVDSAEFGQGVADRVSFMLGSNLTSAKLQVNPPSLGPIEVRIALQAGHAQVWLTSHSAVTRDALESSSPKLREMLGAQGFGQVSVDISQRSFQERTPQPQTYDAMPLADRGEAISSAQPAASIARSASGFLDAYA